MGREADLRCAQHLDLGHREHSVLVGQLDLIE